MADFYLDTKKFDGVINNSKKLAEKLGTLKNDVDREKRSLMDSWVGVGRNEFEKKYRVMSQQFGDIRDDLYDIYEQLLSIEEAYIQQDTDNAKAMDGVTSRY